MASRFFPVFTLIGILLGASACARIPPLVNEYRIDVQQGNVLTQEMTSQLRPGLTRDQVRFILGTPLLTDVFHADRWDYLFRLEEGRTGVVTTRALTVFFGADDLLERVTGDVEIGTVAELTAPVAPTQVVDLGSVAPGEQALPPEDEPGFWGRLWQSLRW
ncbi:MAG: outer membrane protein assembly factor BamE [Zoogloeaceae bacterium]|nr:outer membrane protein assembly factor BamE [Zoogloeaceae bacterium]